MNAAHRLGLARRAALACFLLGAMPLGAGRAGIPNWQTGETIPGTEGITPGPGMVLENWNTEIHNLRYADFSGGLDLSGATLEHSWLDFALFK
jgi:hypothetical protein